MGLTIHYEFEFKGTNEQLLKKIEALRADFLTLDVEKLSPIWEVDPRRFNDTDYVNSMYSKNAGWLRWWMINSANKGYKKHEERGRTYYQPIPNTNATGFSVAIMRGCEPFQVTFSCKNIESKGVKKWWGKVFTKTQYAEHFIKAHALVCEMLDRMKAIGITVHVSDEGDFYETGESNQERDFGALGASFDEYELLIRGMTKALKKVAKKTGLSVVSARDDD